MDSERRAGGAQERDRGGARKVRRVFRSPLAVGFGVVWLAFVVANLIDLALRGTGRDALIIAAVLLLATAIVYVTCLRPRIVAEEAGLTVHNPLRDVRVPWGAVERIDATDAVRLHTAGRRYRCWAVQTSHRAQTRARLREQARAAKVGARDAGPHGQEGHPSRSRAFEVAVELEGMATRLRRDPTSESDPDASVSVTWSPYALAALVAAPVALLVALLIPA